MGQTFGSSQRVPLAMKTSAEGSSPAERLKSTT